MADPATNPNQPQQPEFAIQRLYLKDLSLEVPDSPQVFLQEWSPQLHLDLATQAEKIDHEVHEVVLTLTVTVKLQEKVAFLIEVKQAGLFTLKNFPEDQLHPMLGSFCPNLLYPYAREAVTDIVVKAGFPSLYLSPVNFDALLAEHDQRQQKNNAKTPVEETAGEAGEAH